MNLQSDFRSVTDRITAARKELADVENGLTLARHDVTIAEAELDTARRVLMARSDAGTNDTARRAYAERETAAQNDATQALRNAVTRWEMLRIDAMRDLRIAEDERRYLEFVARLTVTAEPYNAFAHTNGTVEEEFAL